MLHFCIIRFTITPKKGGDAMVDTELMQCAATLAAGMISGNPDAYKTADAAVDLMNSIYGIIKKDLDNCDE